MAEPPTPDLNDSAGRLLRLALALVTGVAIGALAYFVADTLIDPEPEKMIVSRRQMSRFTFVIWVSLLSGVVSFWVSLIVQSRIARKKWEAARLPQARIR